MESPLDECCEPNKICKEIEMGMDHITGETVEVKHCICKICEMEWVE